MKPLSSCRRQFAVATLAVALITTGWAEPPTTTPPPAAVADVSASMDALVAEALASNPERKFYEAELAAARAGRKTAGAFANPEASAGVGQKRATGSGPTGEGVAWSVAVVQPFEWPGRPGLRKAIANRDVELAELGYERFQVALAGRVRMLAYSLFAAQEKSAAATEVAERFGALREILVQRDPAGLTPLLETRVIEATELNAQRRAGEAALATQTALLELNQLRGVPPETRLILRDSNLALPPPSSDRAALVASARTNSFEVRARAVELAQQGFRVALARNERFPSLRVGPMFSEENAGPDRERILGLTLSLPLPLWNQNHGAVESAAARQRQAEVSLQLTEREIERKVLEAALTYETRFAEMARWRADSVQHFKEAAELADRHYRLGAVPIATYVELQKQYLEAVEGLLETRKEALAAAAQLELLTGHALPRSPTPPPTEAR